MASSASPTVTLALAPGRLGITIDVSASGTCLVTGRPNLTSPLQVHDEILSLNGILLADVQVPEGQVGGKVGTWVKLFAAFDGTGAAAAKPAAGKKKPAALTGIAHFTSRAESHSGHCHGGSMTSVMDDVIGWTAFHVTGECVPWSGFTAQVNVTLKRPIEVGSYLKVVGKVVRWEGRKVWIHSELIAGETEEGEEVVHCTAEGLVILKRDA